MTALIWCPFPDRDHAQEVANNLLDEDLIACANILGKIESLYKWNGEKQTGEEIGVLFKTSEELLEQCVERLGALHRYTNPAIMGWACDIAHPATREWLDSLGA